MIDLCCCLLFSNFTLWLYVASYVFDFYVQFVYNILILYLTNAAYS